LMFAGFRSPMHDASLMRLREQLNSVGSSFVAEMVTFATIEGLNVVNIKVGFYADYIGSPGNYVGAVACGKCWDWKGRMS